MKTASTRFLLLPALCAGLAFVAGCTKTEQAEIKADVKDAYADAKTAASNGWAKIRGYTYDRRTDFTNEAKAVSAQIDADISKMRTEYSEATASASRKAAMEELKNSEADYRQKLDALGNATAATWDSARDNVVLAWDKMQAAYYRARAN